MSVNVNSPFDSGLVSTNFSENYLAAEERGLWAGKPNQLYKRLKSSIKGTLKLNVFEALFFLL